MAKFQMMSGYCYVYQGTRGNMRVSNRWGTSVYTPNGREKMRRDTVLIDGARCAVFKCPDGKFRAQTLVSVRVDGTLVTVEKVKEKDHGVSSD